MTTELSQGLAPAVELEVAWLRRPRLPISFEVRLVRATAHAVLVVLQGEVDAHAAPRVRDAVEAALDEGAQAIVIDLGAVSLIDGAGLGVIVTTARRLGLGAVAVVLPHRGLVRIFRTCGLDRLLEIYETREQALHRLLR